MNIAIASHDILQPVPASVIFDEDGFLVDGGAWNPDLAREIAAEEGVGGLGYEHWRILHFIRGYHAEFGAVPMLRRVCRREGIDRRRLKHLFRSCRSAWRIAGLPNPGEEAKSYMN